MRSPEAGVHINVIPGCCIDNNGLRYKNSLAEKTTAGALGVMTGSSVQPGVVTILFNDLSLFTGQSRDTILNQGIPGSAFLLQFVSLRSIYKLYVLGVAGIPESRNQVSGILYPGDGKLDPVDFRIKLTVSIIA